MLLGPALYQHEVDIALLLIIRLYRHNRMSLHEVDLIKVWLYFLSRATPTFNTNATTPTITSPEFWYSIERSPGGLCERHGKTTARARTIVGSGRPWAEHGRTGLVRGASHSLTPAGALSNPDLMRTCCRVLLWPLKSLELWDR